MKSRDSNKYYVYIYKDIKGNIFYVGKGKNNRAYNGERNYQCELYKKLNDWKVEIISYFKDEKEALENELKLIKKYKEGHPITNIIGVNENTTINIFSEEKISHIKYILFLEKIMLLKFLIIIYLKNFKLTLKCYRIVKIIFIKI